MLQFKTDRLIRKQEILLECEFFSGLSTLSKDFLARSLKEISFSPEQLIFMKGDPSDGMYFIAEGMVDISTLQEDGKKISLNRLVSHQFFGEIGFLDNHARTCDATAMTDVYAFKLSRIDFERAALNFKNEEWHSIIKKLCSVLRTINSNLESLIFSDSLIRLIKKILTLPHEIKDQHIVVNISQSELAEMINLSRESTNKLLSQMERNGLIKTSYGKIFLLDRKRLSDYAGGEADAN